MTRGAPLVHHELCFGCGRANLFGLLAELERREDSSVVGRCFLKQDHQGPEAGTAHPGIVAAALIEAISFARGGQPSDVELRFESQAPVGGFLDIEATSRQARASSEGRLVASATAAVNPTGARPPRRPRP
ncbi:MAG TPA: hypothetical protein VGF81_10985 [Solirubrobacteraceae bacterium]